jgi:hypothetical protein
MGLEVKSFHITWDNHLREKERYSWQPIEVESMGRTVSWEFTLEDGTVIKGSEKLD